MTKDFDCDREKMSQNYDNLKKFKSKHIIISYNDVHFGSFESLSKENISHEI